MTLKLLKFSFLVTAAFSSYVQAATSVNDILSTKVTEANNVTTNSPKSVSELCIFSCNLMDVSSHAYYDGVNDLYFLLREKYGLNSRVSCTLYKKTTGNPTLDIRSLARIRSTITRICIQNPSNIC
ncbi:hypothetical protein ACT4YX_11220 [Acinetobacter baumannii]|nr:hypothetical protein [Acinetobacter baumannii]HCV3307530.1 hypothetical protein [Acinetobacter baumannii]